MSTATATDVVCQQSKRHSSLLMGMCAYRHVCLSACAQDLVGLCFVLTVWTSGVVSCVEQEAGMCAVLARSIAWWNLSLQPRDSLRMILSPLRGFATSTCHEWRAILTSTYRECFWATLPCEQRGTATSHTQSTPRQHQRHHKPVGGIAPHLQRMGLVSAGRPPLAIPGRPLHRLTLERVPKGRSVTTRLPGAFLAALSAPAAHAGPPR